jgi:hypothetical protein
MTLSTNLIGWSEDHTSGCVYLGTGWSRDTLVSALYQRMELLVEIWFRMGLQQGLENFLMRRIITVCKALLPWGTQGESIH